MKLSDQMGKYWAADGGKAVTTEQMIAFNQINGTLLAFTARGYFTQVMQQEHHHRYYRKWRDVFQVAELYQAVTDSVHELLGYLQVQQTRKLQQLAEQQQATTAAAGTRLNIVTWLLGLPALAFTFLSTIGPQPWETSTAVGILALSLGGIIMIILTQFGLGWQRRTKGDKEQNS